MAATYDPATSAGRVRLLITDTAVAREETRIFDDAEIEAFLDLEPTVLYAAALGLEVIAASEVLIQKRIKLLDLSTDGPAQAKELRELAAAYRGRAADGVGVDAADTSGWAIAELAITPQQVYDRITAEVLRGA